MPDVSIYHGDSLTILPTLEPGYQCCVTSPPYYGLRDYKIPASEWPEVHYAPMAGLEPVTVPAWHGCLGDEPEPAGYVGHLVHVFRLCRALMRRDGTLWVNLGDSFASSGQPGKQNMDKLGERLGCGGGHKQSSHLCGRSPTPTGLKPKDLLGIPWRVAFALQADGWFLRSDICWAKVNCMPESVRDRPTKAHEYVFMLSLLKRYFADMDGVREAASCTARPETSRNHEGTKSSALQSVKTSMLGWNKPEAGRNLRDVWTIATVPFSARSVGIEGDDHYAVMTPLLAERCLSIGTSRKGRCPECGAQWGRVVDSKGEARQKYYSGAEQHGRRMMRNGQFFSEKTTTGWRPSCSCGAAPVPCRVLDPYLGAGTTALVASRLGLDCDGIEINEASVRIAETRIRLKAPETVVRVVSHGTCPF